MSSPPPQDPAASNRPTPALELIASRGLVGWMREQQVSFAFSTYQAGKLFLVGVGTAGRLSVFERTFNRCMGLWSDGQSMLLSTLFQLWQLENALEPGQTHEGYDRVFVPRVAYTTGDVDIHDVGRDAAGRIVFVNTLFACLATVSATHSFVPVWVPPWISRLAAEDRCHLNGLAFDDGHPAYVTAVSRSDVADGWREHRHDAGCVVDVRTRELVLDGLSMPHSPRLSGGTLWLLESGTGYLGRVDVERAQFERVTFCPGFARGLAFVGPYAVVGTSKHRGNHNFDGLQLGRTLESKHAEARCGLQVIDTRSGDVVHWLRIEGVVKELYDVALLHGVTRPMAIGLVSDEIRHVIRVGDVAPLEQPIADREGR